jgi:hypothetical protein
MPDDDLDRSPAEPVTLTVSDLPTDIAEEVRHLQTEDPEWIRRSLVYGVTHRAIFQTLLANSWGRL